MAGTLIKLTNAGRAALVGPGNVGTVTRTITQIGVATAAFVHNDDLVALPNELKKINTFGGENVAPDTVHVTLRDDTADQYTLFGFGLYLDNGALLGTYSQDTPILEKSPAAMLLLSADMLFTTIDAALLQFGSAEWTNPPATETRQGVVELATTTETQAGVDGTRAVTPAGLASLTATEARAGLAEVATQAEVSAGADDSRFVTPKKLAVVTALLAAINSPNLTGTPTAPTPAFSDDSTRIATTAFVQGVVRDAAIGQFVFEPRTTARAGYLKANGALLNRADYPKLWAYAQASGALVSEAAWLAGSYGCFSTGDGATTFRIPELRGEGIRCWDDSRGIDASRGIGSWQDSQNKSHTHGASASTAPDHAHSAWTDAQGWHAHGVTDPGHNHNIAATLTSTPNGAGDISLNANPGQLVSGRVGNSPTGVSINGDGTHAHNVGVGNGGSHSHTVSINADGGTEARGRNVATLAMIRAY